jgi:hypothetical protein
MTGKQAILQLKAKLNQLDTAANRTVRPEMALLFLNNAYDKLAEAKYAKTQEGDSHFESNQLAKDELNHLTVPTELVPTKVGDEYEIAISDIENYWIHLRSSVRVVSNAKNYWITDLNFKTLDTVNTIEDDPFNRSEAKFPVVYFEGNKIKIIAKDFIVDKYKITYYRKPKTITLDEVIEAPFADDIVDAAVVMMLENWGDPRTQSKMTVDKVIDSE